MEIIHLILGKANPDRMNGVNKVVYQLATEQAKAGKNVSVWGITKNTTHDYPERNFNTQLFKSTLNPFSVNKELVIEIKKHKDATFHLHGGWIPVFSSLSKVFYEQNIKFVLTPHGAYNSVAMDRNFLIKKIYFNLFEKKLLQRANKIHSIGSSEVEGLNSIYQNEKSFLLPYGFDLPLNTKDLKQKQEGDFIVGFVGRIDIYTKGLDVLVDAFKEFNVKHSNTKLWIIGDSNELGVLKKRAQSENIIFFGKKFGTEKNELIKGMDIFAHPSRNEGLPTAVLEAASFGIPSIVSKTTNVGEYVSEYNAGFQIENSSKEPLVKALELAYQNRFENLSENCLKMLKEKFSWGILVERYDELYQ
jgi:glycosyltransferase involved in cell wall biosynthesis